MLKDHDENESRGMSTKIIYSFSFQQNYTNCHGGAKTWFDFINYEQSAN